MKIVLHPKCETTKEELLIKIDNFDKEGVVCGDGRRNIIKVMDLKERKINIKSFQIPRLPNRLIYYFFRKSKAQRSFEYADHLLKNDIGTPHPFAYIEKYSAVGLHESFYISEHLQTELTFRELVTIPDYPDHENILRQFTAFCFKLHQKGIEFLDHSPGNTLIKKLSDDKYGFFLVDLNRMKFHSAMTLEQRMHNLQRLTYKEEMIAVMSDEYAKLSGSDYNVIFGMLNGFTINFHKKLQRKKRIKAKLRFWLKK
ncbi:MAG TPA: lipopolysaccharide kinase InaA family protein [Flavobacterium sp.]|jgi:hypothetical protein